MSRENPAGRPVISGKTRVVGVWGHPVGHSRSPAMHNAALEALGLDWVYVPFDVAPEQLAAAVAGLRALGLAGVNVTVPLKEAVLPYLDVLDEEAERIGAVNTIHNAGGVLHGSNTDGAGFLRALAECGEPSAGRRVLLLGAGGSARATALALAGADSVLWIANRSRERAETLAELVNRYHPGHASVAAWGSDTGLPEEIDLIVNTTSLGMSPQEQSLPPLPPGLLRPGRFVYDLVYAPPETLLLARARQAGCRGSNGLGMLVWQGALSLSRWTECPLERVPVGRMRAAVEAQP